MMLQQRRKVNCLSTGGGMILLAVLLILSGYGVVQAAGVSQAAMDECLLKAMATADDSMTIGQLKTACKAELAKTGGEIHEEALEKRLAMEEKSTSNLWTIMPHRQNYILLANYNFQNMNTEPWNEITGREVKLNETEVKFQISFKFMLWEQLFKRDIDFYFAYTQLAMWQLYNSDISSPFRDTNYEPEAFLWFNNDWEIFGFTNRVNLFGFAHQSNGRAEPLSRSWNRVFASFVFERGRLAFGIKPWIRISEDDEDDDNPDIEDYLGNFELRSAYKWNRHTFSLKWRNNLDFDSNRGAIQLGWSFPLPKTDRVKGYVQYFNGYGQSLLDYNHSSATLGAGFLLADWL
jgi:phospholipase A1